MTSHYEFSSLDPEDLWRDAVLSGTVVFDVLDSEPGPWVVAGFDGECIWGCAGIQDGEVVRHIDDNEMAWEHKECHDAGEPVVWRDEN